MAEQCSVCGRADQLQPDLVNYQCVACGSLTNIATGQAVPTGLAPGAGVSVSGRPVVELSSVTQSPTGTEAGSLDAEHRLRPGDPFPHPAPDEVTVVAPVPEPESAPEAPVEAPVAPEVEAAPVPEPIDLATLTPEQVAAIEAIAHPEVTNG